MNNDLLSEKSIITSNRYTSPDYRQKFSESHVDVGLTELLGRRSNQEDNVSVTPLQNFPKLSNDERKKFWHDSFTEMANQVSTHNHAKDQGSCAIACVSYVKQEKNKNYACVSTANLGDSSVFIAVRNKTTGKITVERITQELHHPDDKDEISRVNKITDKYKKTFPSMNDIDEYKKKGGVMTYISGGSVMDIRNQALAVTRAFGDLSYNYKDDAVISTNPATLKDEKKVELSDKEEVFIITACDGFTERSTQNADKSTYKVKSGESKGADAKLVESLLTDILKENPGCSTDVLSQKLAEAARDRCKSGDNISVIVRHMTKDSTPVMTAVFDGHGGSEISKFVSEKFPSIAQKKLEEGLRLQTSPPRKKQKASNNPSAISASDFDYNEPPPRQSFQTSLTTTTQTAPTTTGISQEDSPNKRHDKQFDQLKDKHSKAYNFAKDHSEEASNISKVLDFYLTKVKKQHPNAVKENFNKLVEDYKKDKNDDAIDYIDVKAEQIMRAMNVGPIVTPTQISRPKNS